MYTFTIITKINRLATLYKKAPPIVLLKDFPWIHFKDSLSKNSGRLGSTSVPFLWRFSFFFWRPHWILRKKNGWQISINCINYNANQTIVLNAISNNIHSRTQLTVCLCDVTNKCGALRDLVPFVQF